MPLLYTLALEHLLHQLKNRACSPALCGISVCGITQDFACSNDVSIFVSCRSNIEVVQKAFERYVKVTGPKIDHKPSGLRLGVWEVSRFRAISAGEYSWGAVRYQAPDEEILVGGTVKVSRAAGHGTLDEPPSRIEVNFPMPCLDRRLDLGEELLGTLPNLTIIPPVPTAERRSKPRNQSVFLCEHRLALKVILWSTDLSRR